MNYVLPAGLMIATGLGALAIALVWGIPTAAISITRSVRVWRTKRGRRERRRAFHRRMKRMLATTARGSLLTRHPSDAR